MTSPDQIIRNTVLNKGIKIIMAGAALFLISAVCMALDILSHAAFFIALIGWCIGVYGILKMKG
jgi:hypothetical protein